MLKKRIIPIQLLKDGRLVKSRNFGEFRDVGDPVKSSGVYNSQTADELVLLNVSRDNRDIGPLVETLERVAKVSFMPLAVGGGVTSIKDARALFSAGADKIVVNTAAYRNPDLLRAIAERFGSQAVIAAIDVNRAADGTLSLLSDCGRTVEEVGLDEHIQRCIDHGAGEILVQAIHRDGFMEGYDLELVGAACRASSIPVIAAGGAGDYSHLAAAFSAGDLSAVACGSLFNFSDSNPIRARSYLRNYGLAFRNG